MDQWARKKKKHCLGHPVTWMKRLKCPSFFHIKSVQWSVRTSHCSFFTSTHYFFFFLFSSSSKPLLLPLFRMWWLVVRGCWLRLFFLLVLVRLLIVVVSSCWSPSRLVDLLPLVVLLLPCYGGLDLFFFVSHCVLFCVLVCIISPMVAFAFSFSPAIACACFCCSMVFF